MAKLAQKPNRIIVKDYFENLKELATLAIRCHKQGCTDL
jgi:hypothetical protein